MDEIENIASEEDVRGPICSAKSIRSSIKSKGNVPSTSKGTFHKTESTVATVPSVTETVVNPRSVSQVALNPDTQSIATTSDKTSNGSNKVKFSKDLTPEPNKEQGKNTRQDSDVKLETKIDNTSNMSENLFFLPLVISRETLKSQSETSAPIQSSNSVRSFQVPLLQTVASNINKASPKSVENMVAQSEILNSFLPSTFSKDESCKLLPLIQFLPLSNQDINEDKSVKSRQDLLLNLAQAMEKELKNHPVKGEQTIETPIEVKHPEDDKSVCELLLPLVQSIVKVLLDEKICEKTTAYINEDENPSDQVENNSTDLIDSEHDSPVDFTSTCISEDEKPFDLVKNKSCIDFIRSELDYLVYDFKSNAQTEAEFQLNNILVNLPLDTPPFSDDSIESLNSDVTVLQEVSLTLIKCIDESVKKSESPLSLLTTSESDELEFIVDDKVSLRSFKSKSMQNCFFFKTSGIVLCRICHEVDQKDSFISPCNCKGSLSWVHMSCLEHWLAESDSSHCELCGFKYDIKRNPRYSLPGSIIAWFKSSRTYRKDVFLDVIAAITLAPLAGLGTYIGLLLAEALNFDDITQNISLGTLTGRVAAVCIVSLMTTLDVAYATWAAVRLQSHLDNWYAWYRRNSTVTVNITNRGPT